MAMASGESLAADEKLPGRKAAKKRRSASMEEKRQKREGALVWLVGRFSWIFWTSY